MLCFFVIYISFLCVWSLEVFIIVIDCIFVIDWSMFHCKWIFYVLWTTHLECCCHIGKIRNSSTNNENFTYTMTNSYSCVCVCLMSCITTIFMHSCTYKINLSRGHHSPDTNWQYFPYTSWQLIVLCIYYRQCHQYTISVGVYSTKTSMMI